jgi:D-glycero-beta-D-manno-heptose 1-phosphate adenylyltransferase
VGEIIQIDRLDKLGSELRERGVRIVFTNGHFDLVHVGHLRYLQQAKSMGDCLIVGINDDATTTARKGPRRPILPEHERVELVAGLACVDFAVIFHEPTAEHVIETLRPDIYVKGGDYTLGPAGPGTPLPEAATVRAYGGSVQIIPLEPGQSTSAIEHRIIERWQTHGQDPS